MVHAVIEYCVGLLLIAVVAQKQARRMALVQPDDDFALHAVIHVLAVFVHQRDVVGGRGTAGAAGLGLHPLAGHQQRRGLALAEALVNLHAREPEELVIHFGVERLARAVGPFQGAQVVAGEILLDEEAVHRGRRAKAGHAVLFQHFEQVGGDEAVKVVHKQRGAADPLAIELAPARLGPAGIGHGHVDGVVPHVVPVIGRHRLRDGVGPAVRGHLGHAGGAAGEVDEHDIVVLRQLGGLVPLLGGSGHLRVKIQKARFVAQREQRRKRIALRCGGQHVFAHLRLLHAQDGAGAGSLNAVDNVLLLQLRRGGNQHAAQLEQAHCRYPELPAALEHQNHGVALFEAVRLEHIGRLVAHAADFAKGEGALMPLEVAPDQRPLIGRDARVFVHHIVGEMEMFGHLEGKVFFKILLRRQVGTNISVSQHTVSNSFGTGGCDRPDAYGITMARKCTASPPTASMACGVRES